MFQRLLHNQNNDTLKTNDKLKDLILPNEIEYFSTFNAAIQNGLTEIVKCFLDYLKESPLLVEQLLTSKDSSNKISLQHACGNYYIEVLDTIFQYLKNHGKQSMITDLLVHIEDRFHRFTVLNNAIEYGRAEFLKFLLEYLKDDDKSLMQTLMRKDTLNNTALYYACDRNHIDVIKVVFQHLKDKHNLLQQLLMVKNSKTNNTLIHLACNGYHSDVLTIIFEHFKCKNAQFRKIALQRNENNDTILHVACVEGDKDVVTKVICHVASHKNILKDMLIAKNKTTPLHFICEKGYIEIIQLMLSQFTDNAELKELLLMKDDSNQTVFHVSCKEGHTDVVRAIMQCIKNNHDLIHAVVFAKDADDSTIFHWASRYNHPKILNIIFEHLNTKNGDFIRKMATMKDGEGTTILHMACVYGHEDVTKVILEQVKNDTALLTELVLMTDNKKSDKPGQTPLHLASYYGYIDVINILFEYIKGISKVLETLIRCPNQTETTALHYACQHGFPDIVDLLFKYSNKHMVTEMVKLGDKYDRSPLYLACQFGRNNVVAFLLRYFKANDNILEDLLMMKSKDDMTPIEVASKYGHFNCIPTLLDHNYDATKKMLTELDKSDEVTILLDACQHGHKDAVKSILTAIYEVERREVVDLMSKFNATDIEGKRSLHIACNRGDTDVVRNILDHIQNMDATTAAQDDEDQNDDSDSDSESESAESSVDSEDDYDDSEGGEEDDVDNDGDDADDGDDDDGNDETHFLCHKDSTERTALHECCQQGDHHIVKMLLDAVPDENSTLMVQMLCNQDDRKHASLWEAFENGHYIIVKNILTEASKFKCVQRLLLECRNGKDQTIFHRACRYKYSNIRCLEAVVRIAHLYKDDNEDDNSNNSNNCKTTQTLIKELLLAEDRYGKTFLFYIAESNEDVMHLLIKIATDWEQNHPESDSICYELLTHQDTSGKTALIYTNEAKKLFVLTDFLDPFYDQIKKNTNDLKHPRPRDFTLFHRKIIDYDKHQKESLLTAIGDAKCLDLIQHGYTKDYLNISWTTHVRYFFFTNLFLYLILLLLLSTFVVTHQYEKVNGTSNTDLVFTQKPNWLQYLLFPLVIFAALNFSYEILQMKTKRRHYWKAQHNYVDLAVCLGSLGLSISVMFIDYGVWHHRIGATVMCMAWINAAWMMTKIPNFSKSSLPQKVILMFTMMFRVIGRVCIFIPVFATFTLTFALCFHTLIQVQQPFSNVGYSIIKTIGMTIGELDFGDIFFSGDAAETPPFYILSCILFVVFLGIMTISAMNLLVGMAVGDINELSADSEVLAFNTLVDLTLESQAILPMIDKVSKAAKNKVDPEN